MHPPTGGFQGTGGPVAEVLEVSGGSLSDFLAGMSDTMEDATAEGVSVGSDAVSPKKKRKKGEETAQGGQAQDEPPIPARSREKKKLKKTEAAKAEKEEKAEKAEKAEKVEKVEKVEKEATEKGSGQGGAPILRGRHKDKKKPSQLQAAFTPPIGVIHGVAGLWH